MRLDGIRVFRSEFAVQHETVFEVVRVAIPKRRKRWRVVKTSRQIPCAMQTPQGLFVHPSIYDALVARPQGEK